MTYPAPASAGEGWDRWEELNRRVLAPPAGRDGGRAVHAVVEGGGGADVQAAWEYRRRSPGALVRGAACVLIATFKAWCMVSSCTVQG